MRLITAIGVCALCASASAVRAEDLHLAAAQQDLADLSIEELANLQVSSVSKRNEPLSAAPAALYVIDHEQIVRSGAVTIPEILRLAPNLQIYQSTPSTWVATARGLNGFPEAQSFSNKLLVLIDGRTVYTPLFSGVYWDLPDLLPDDIERIEVISGPGATLWGANAVNGVINIITRSAGATSGAYADVRAGTVQQAIGLRFAGAANDDLSYRVYARLLRENAGHAPTGGSRSDDRRRLGGGFRLDWTPDARDRVTFQGDIFEGRGDQPGPAHEDVSGHDLVLRWNRDVSPKEQIQVQAFYDRFRRATAPDNGSFHASTYDIDVLHSFALGDRHQVVWGGGGRIVHYDINGTPSLFFQPASRNLFLGNIFVQDTFALSDAVSVTAGLKAERDPYVGFSFLPNVRLAIKPSDTTLLWAAASHAVRSPTPFDEDVQERVGTIVALSGNRDFRTEKLTAYELGVRAQPLSGLSFSATGFYHHYNDLRTVEMGTGPATLLNLFWANGLKGNTYGLEAWASYSPLSWWTLSAGAMLQHQDFDFKEGATLPAVGTWQNGVDPGHQFTLRSSMDLTDAIALDLDLRNVGRLKHTDVSAYTELGGRIAWNVSDHLTLSVSGSNLLHDRHVEYPGGDAISRRVLLGLEWRS
jgi:iron complex outermembrane receptor protein